MFSFILLMLIMKTLKLRRKKHTLHESMLLQPQTSCPLAKSTAARGPSPSLL
ncbi:hypothetical protein HanIR_Chr10g0482631 [Helianthus annuus]|nr:hypothetical protein HanIR_Chr10g0482631 [Helianthus annuus]